MEKKTVLFDVRSSGQGEVFVRFKKIFPDGTSGTHATSFFPGIDVERHIKDVNDNLTNVHNAAAPSDEEWNPVRAKCAEVHTPEMIAAFIARRDAGK